MYAYMAYMHACTHKLIHTYSVQRFECVLSHHLRGLPIEVRKQLLHVCLERLLVAGGALSLNFFSPGKSSTEMLHQWDKVRKTEAPEPRLMRPAIEVMPCYA